MSNDAPQPSPPAAPEQHAVSSPPEHRHVDASSSQTLLQLSDDTSAAGRAPEEGKHPKGKRKRTAAKDKMILEEAYKNNPKPDKQARLEIVDRVSLSEKEVQIWFQNRRQNDRRKSRPLSPEELAALRYGGIHCVSSDSGTPLGANPESDRPFPASDPAAVWASVSPTFNHNSPDHSQSFADASLPRQGSQETTTPAQPGKTPPQGEDTPSSQPSQPTETMAHSFSSSVGYLANRWNLGSSFSTPSSLRESGEESLKPESCPPSSCPSDTGRNATKSQSHAEHESNGSAIAAISLLRSSSGILQSSSTKRNASVSRPPQARQAKKAKFGRTSSTYARLENVGTGLDKPGDSFNGKVKVAMLVSSNDSDKENWSPDEDDQKRPGLLNSRANTAPSGLSGSAKGAVEIYEDPVKRSRDDEVARFMRGEVSPSKKGDMDCVAGLLSLSQGAWR
ncbi:homeobox domain-containing protein [Hirsutella rhossiliensis]|uniref:Homeobox domain-containing protein n=1 Tax=Hirsutella rhossiliensis TaxID=111463 RepID=A0A9P8SNM8_9HYPO|nr:homeobox domain-containing protein [Hirsutella rhossiliensis]KAH0967326.1 homeobox domain-containing protein [Hirsutella rhossiliensis]